MPISPVNQSKNTVSPVGARKYGTYLWGDAFATWGDALATWGTFSLNLVNQTKSAVTTYLELQNGNLFLLQDGTNLEMQGGASALVYINQSKN
jgi:hypothetical protein